MKLKKFFLNFFNNWTKPILFFIVSLLLLFSIVFLSTNITLENISFYILIIAVLCILISIVLQIIKGQFLKSFLTLCVLGLGALVFFYASIALFWKTQSMPDGYADKLTIPKDIKIYLPSDTTFSVGDTIPNFQLYNSFQPGLYSYSLWTKKIEKGYCYLKAFEIIHNDPLSVDRLKARSRIDVFNPSDTLKRFDMENDNNNSENIFTIYEGDWDKPYAARFEVWFVPANGGQEQKLVEKNFKIEGWMR
jgi:energy-coupling factor transporter transmembrane protein EcfT